ncbi:MAG: hypothetical protein IPJ20_20595 [Flammeovirgaceae bacterium]|nr:hypothetical protein [Flammeovirgaceae bacterium]
MIPKEDLIIFSYQKRQMETNSDKQALLAAIGLKEVMVEKDSIDPFDRKSFTDLSLKNICNQNEKRWMKSFVSVKPFCSIKLRA